MPKIVTASLIALLIAAPVFAQDEIQPVITVTSEDDCYDAQLFPTEEERDACIAVFMQGGGVYTTQAALVAAVVGFMAALGGGGSGTTTTTTNPTPLGN